MPSSCIVLPHGLYSFLPTLLTTLGWMAALFEDTCNYAKVSGDIVSSISELKVPYLEVGLQAYREPTFNVATGQWESVHNENCIAYPDAEITMDTPWVLAKAFTFLALILGGSSTLYLWISTCCRFSRGSWLFAGYQLAGACLFQILSFVWFQTQMCAANQCQLFYGSKADVAAAVLWMIATLLILGHYPVPKEFPDGDGLVHSKSDGSGNFKGRSHTKLRIDIIENEDDDNTLPMRSNTSKSCSSGDEMAAGENSQQDGRIGHARFDESL
jgi:hypothetical protein